MLSLIESCLCVSVQELHDMFGPSTARAELQALVVSHETLSGGKMVNDKRLENGVCV